MLRFVQARLELMGYYVDMEPRIPFTAAAFASFQAELETLRPRVAELLEKVKAAREMGDLSENGAYRYGKFELGNVRRRVRQLEYLLMNGEIKSPLQDGKVGFGNTVVVQSPAGRAQYLLVSKYESDPVKGKLSLESPIGRALLRKRVGDRVKVSIPAGEVEYTILEIF